MSSTPFDSLKVKYGAAGKFKDVKAIFIKNFIINNNIFVPKTINMNKLFTDPAVGIEKKLIIEIRNRQYVYPETLSENIFLSLVPGIPVMQRKFKTILFTNARNENNMLEWTLHHLQLGFNHIYIVDHLSDKPLSAVLKKVPNVTVMRNNQNVIEKGDLMRNAVQYAQKNKYDWMLYLDADEFLCLHKYNDAKLYPVDAFLSAYNDKADQIGLNWLQFGSNFHEKTPAGTILENYTKSEKALDRHVKSFLRCSCYVSVCTPHAYQTTDMSRSLSTNLSTLDEESPYWFHNDTPVDDLSAFVAHYIYQSKETFIQRKIKLPRDDAPGVYREMIDVHQFYNDMDNFSVRDKYNDANKAVMAMYKA